MLCTREREPDTSNKLPTPPNLVCLMPVMCMHCVTRNVSHVTPWSNRVSIMVTEALALGRRRNICNHHYDPDRRSSGVSQRLNEPVQYQLYRQGKLETWLWMLRYCLTRGSPWGFIVALGCLLNRLFRRRSKNIKAPRHWPWASNAENVSIWWRHQGYCGTRTPVPSKHAITCLNWARTGPMLPALARFWPS